jgi:hypothetical protein
MPSHDDTTADRYAEAVGPGETGRYAVRLEELGWLLRSSLRLNTSRLRLLTALQRGLPEARGEQERAPEAGPVGELKGVLTNLIIMQTRLNEREADLARLLERADDQGLATRVDVDPDDVRGWASNIARAWRHIERRASGAGGDS